MMAVSGVSCKSGFPALRKKQRTGVLSELRQSDYRGEVFCDYPLKKLTTWRIGGPADYYFIPEDTDSLRLLISVLETREIPWIVLGSGSNVLFMDAGFRGAVIRLGYGFSGIQVKGCRIISGAGALLRSVTEIALRSNLTGLAELAGVPGTIGAAARINAGAFGVNFLDRVVSISGFNRRLESWKITDIESRYRTGQVFPGAVITQVEIELERGERSRIAAQMEACRDYRRRTQPVTAHSAGCTFVNPAGTGAGRLIDESGLKGLCVGQACISEKHANFIVNRGDASARDVLALIREAHKQVRDRFGVDLQVEVRIFDESGTRIQFTETCPGTTGEMKSNGC